MIKCVHCETLNDPNNNYCCHCGKKLGNISHGPTYSYEIFLKIINPLGIIMAIYKLIEFNLNYFVCILGGTTCFTSNFINIAKKNFSISIIIFTILVIINIATILKMRDINKNTNYKGNYLVKKRIYIITAFLFGALGIHRYIAGDYIRGRIFLYITLCSLIFSLIVVMVFPFVVIMYSSLYIVISIIGITDGLIAISKFSNEEGKIYV